MDIPYLQFFLIIMIHSSWVEHTRGSTTRSRSQELIDYAQQEMPELFREAPETIRNYGYPVETHKVVTEDGYVLTLHRIPWGKSVENITYPRVPVLFFHGIFGGSDTWVIGGPGISPAFFVADSGYDVWLANGRGNFYSRGHLNMTDKNPNFWRFSWHEMGIYDLPAIYDYIIKFTGQENLIYFAHSMGNNVFYVMISSQPKYITKTRLHIALSPAVFWNNVNSVFANAIRNNNNIIKIIMDHQNTYELLSPSAARNALYYFACRKNSTQRKTCLDIYSGVIGNARRQNPLKIPIYLARMLESTSGLTLVHLAQNARSGKFQQFDHGRKLNRQYYGSIYPPQYDLKKAVVPAVLYTSIGDDLVPIQGVRRLSCELPVAVDLKIVRDEVFSHLDFVVHPNLYNLVLENVLRTMADY